MHTDQELAQMRAAQRQAEADAQEHMNFYESHPGVPVVAAGHENTPLQVPLGPVSGVHGRAS